jgi:amidase
MHGSGLGVGSDIAGSIRIPAMCNRIYSVNSSWERLSYAGQQDGSLPGASKVGIAASIGPLTRSVRDVELFFRAVLGWRADSDVIYKPWMPVVAQHGRKLRIGMLCSDALTSSHPPFPEMLYEVEESMKSSGVETTNLDISSMIAPLQALAGNLFNIEGGNNMQRLLQNEPLSPWLSNRFRTEEPQALLDVFEFHAQPERVCQEMLAIWQDEGGDIDAIICPVAPHPVAPIDRFNTINYTSSFVVLKYPAAVLPIRAIWKVTCPRQRPLGLLTKSIDNCVCCRFAKSEKRKTLTAHN